MPCRQCLPRQISPMGRTQRCPVRQQPDYVLVVDCHRLVVDCHRLVADLRRLVADLRRLVTDLRRLVTDLRRLVADLRRLVAGAVAGEVFLGAGAAASVSHREGAVQPHHHPRMRLRRWR